MWLQAVKSVHKLCSPSESGRKYENNFSILQIFLHRGLEFAEEADVVLEVEAEVLDLPFEHGDALYAHSEGEPGVLLGVDAAGFQDVGIHHAGTHDLQPAGALADVAALAAADVAADVLGSVKGK